MGNGNERECVVPDCVRAWQALVRPVLEYGVVVWGDAKWEQAERVQRERWQR